MALAPGLEHLPPHDVAHIHHHFNMITNPVLLNTDENFPQFIAVHANVFHDVVNVHQTGLGEPLFPKIQAGDPLDKAYQKIYEFTLAYNRAKGRKAFPFGPLEREVIPYEHRLLIRWSVQGHMGTVLIGEGHVWSKHMQTKGPSNIIYHPGTIFGAWNNGAACFGISQHPGGIQAHIIHPLDMIWAWQGHSWPGTLDMGTKVVQYFIRVFNTSPYANRLWFMCSTLALLPYLSQGLYFCFWVLSSSRALTR
ncbi:hypothetical protein SISNIDRAFT_471499 [Sistotremastrum niveocremeum HHB9708]|uniref:Uncharacterized protein n=1 Tax=Sistotremastrum niveocremeum HHB9708 TaxID=1314777 RepID=A0A164MKA9_9AGAM|nr:hypothetical protein SISNIDRAFT_471499 [Sistotremastrum niveocremeum HHB9708]